MSKVNRYRLLMCLALMLWSFAGLSQAKTQASKKLFAGSWVNRKAQRHLTISYDDQDYVTINDWHGKWSEDNNTIDAYKAWPEKNKLVMPGSTTDLRCPYCEILRTGNALLYRCQGMASKDKAFIENIWFVREKN